MGEKVREYNRHGHTMTKESDLAALAGLVHDHTVAALGTLHNGAPYVSMVPYALLPDGSAFVIHVSRLAAHTRDMLDDSRVSLLVTQAEGAGVPAQARARVTILGEAAEAPRESAEARACRDAYLRRLPDAEPLTAFGDFSFFRIRPAQVRFVAGFARATSFTAESLVRALRTGD